VLATKRKNLALSSNSTSTSCNQNLQVLTFSFQFFIKLFLNCFNDPVEFVNTLIIGFIVEILIKINSSIFLVEVHI
jgi:hypothetical protein